MFPKFLIDASLIANRVSCGPEGYTLCARFYEARLNGKTWGRVAVHLTDKLFWFDKNHCYKSFRMRKRK